MNFDYLNDTEFLYKLDNLKVKETYVKITVLSFNDEQPIREIQGRVSAGSITVNGSSRIRRTINLTIVADANENDLTDVENIISINKKIKVYIGRTNPFPVYQKKYGDIIWFKGGTFVVSTASMTKNATTCNISITGKDKMVLLDGSVGGALPAAAVFSERYEYKINDAGEEEVEVTYPTLVQIIREAVHHIGEQPINDIIINDLEETAKMLVKYIGNDPVYFNTNYTAFSFSPSDDYPFMYSLNDDVGYMVTDFTYPGELALAAGDSIVTLLDKICEVLGNYEYFFDLDGKFVFQEIKNYLNTNYPSYILNQLSTEQYIQQPYTTTKYKYSLANDSTIVSYNVNPKYENIKNDFIVWGTRSLESGGEREVRYHLSINTKPTIDLANKYMYEVIEDERTNYVFTDEETEVPNGKLIALPCSEWREELYRQALLNSKDGLASLRYEEELLTEWRYLFDTIKSEWAGGWNPDVQNNPSALNYWLDFIDTNSHLSQYSVNMIGTRTIAKTEDKATSIFNKTVPDVMFIDYDEVINGNIDTEEMRREGQNIFLLADSVSDYFTASSTAASCFDKIRELLYQHLIYTTSVSVTCSPKYYLEPNNLVYIYDKQTGINGNYLITQFTIPLTYNGTMNITAAEVAERL